MKKISILILFSFTLLVSCDFGGVKPRENKLNENGLLTVDSTLNSDTLGNALITEDKPYALLTDSLEGEVNSMVYQEPSGLRVEWTEKNEGNPIKLNDVVMVNYDARVAAGEHYDSNKELGKPVPLKTNIGMMVEGWEKGLLKMNIGDKGRIMIPAAMGYGENGYLTIVPPDADLIIEIEIVERVKPIVLEEGVKVYRWKSNAQKPLPKKNQLITFDYFAYTQGKKAHLYDNSYQNQEPFRFKFENDNVVDGLHQGMSVLREGESAFIEIPAKLAYGTQGLVDLVPKNTPIVYDVRISNID